MLYNLQMAAAWAHLVEVLAELEQAQAHTAELQRRLEHAYGKRRCLIQEARDRILEIHVRLHKKQDHREGGEWAAQGEG